MVARRRGGVIACPLHVSTGNRTRATIKALPSPHHPPSPLLILKWQWYIYIKTCTFASNTLYCNNPPQQGCPFMQTYQSLLISTLHIRFNTILWHPYPVITDADMQVFLETKHTYLDSGGFGMFTYIC